jgi:uncharacterized spore protein YtfJ
MQVDEILQKAKDAADIHQVYGEPYERNGITIIPVARVTGGGGGGTGPTPDNKGTGSGGGYGFRAEPAGVYVINGDKVTWQPAVNVNRIIGGAFAVAIVAIVRFPRILKRLQKLFG